MEFGMILTFHFALYFAFSIHSTLSLVPYLPS